MNKKNRYLIVAGIAFILAFSTKAVEIFLENDLSLERYILVGIVFPLFVMIHFMHHLKNPDFYENKKEFKVLSVVYKYVFIPSCILYILGGLIFNV